MERETIQDEHFNTLGYIEDVGGGKVRASDAHFNTVGYYDPQSNQTQDAHFQTVAHGNVLSALIYKQAQNEIQQASSSTTQNSIAGGEPRSGTSKPASCSGILAAIFIVVGGAIYNWWGELTHNDGGTNSVTTAQVGTEADQQPTASTRIVSPNSDKPNSSLNPAVDRPQEQELRGAILHALDTGTPVQWEAAGKSGWISVSALMSTTGDACRAVAITDDDQRPLSAVRTWCRRNGSDWRTDVDQ